MDVWLPKNRDISCAIIGKFTQGNKVEEKRLTHRLVIDEGELDFLIQDCVKEGTYAGSDKCPLGHIFTYYEGHQPQYTHLRASMLAYAHINLLEMLQRFGPNEVVRIATDSIYIRREALYKIKNVPAFWRQHQRTKSSQQQPTPGQWRDKGEKIYGPDPHIIYWPKDRHWELIKDIPDSTAPTIHDPITRSRVSYLNGGGGSGKTTRA